nr:hypothetical protein [Nostoc sp. DedQUE02]
MKEMITIEFRTHFLILDAVITAAEILEKMTNKSQAEWLLMLKDGAEMRYLNLTDESKKDLSTFFESGENR